MNYWYKLKKLERIRPKEASEAGFRMIEWVKADIDAVFYQVKYRKAIGSELQAAGVAAAQLTTLKFDSKEFFDPLAAYEAGEWLHPELTKIMRYALREVLEDTFLLNGGDTQRWEQKSSQGIWWGIKHEDKLRAFLNTHIENSTLITKRFHIDPGNKPPGHVQIQVIVGLTHPVKQEFLDLLDDIDPTWKIGAKPPTASTVKASRTYDVKLFTHLEQLDKLRQIFIIFQEKNKMLKQSYAYDFSVLSKEFSTYSILLKEKYQNRILGSKFHEVLAKEQITGKLGEKKTFDKDSYILQYSFMSIKIPTETTDVATQTPAIEEKEVIFFKDPPSLYLVKSPILSIESTLFPSLSSSSENLPVYSMDFIRILYNLTEILGYLSGLQDDFELEEFVNKFFDPIPSKLAKKEQAQLVYNNAKKPTKHKTAAQLERERLSEKTKQEVFDKVKDKYNIVGDQAFLEIVKNYQDIKTVEDVFEQVIKVVPLDNLIEEAVTCLLKQIPNVNIKKIVCDTILGDLTIHDIDKILKYLTELTEYSVEFVPGLSEKEKKKITEYVSVGGQKIKKKEVKRVKKELQKFINERDSFDKKEKAALIAYIDSDMDARDIICAAILAVLPAAIYLLAKLSSIPWGIPGTDKIDIVNPVKEFLEKIKKALDKMKVTSITADWAALITALVYAFIATFVVAAVKALLEQIGEMCEESAESDFAGMGTLPGQGLPPTLDATFPFVPFALRDFIDKADAEDVYRDLALDLDLDLAPDEIGEDLIKDFLDDLSNFLTISELCALLSEDGNKDYIIQKIYFGILQQPEYKKILKALNSEAKIKQFFYILGQSVNKAQCVKKLDNLVKTKKFLSDLCGPSKNGALIEDLKNKATADTLLDLLNQQDKMANNVLQAVLDLSDADRLASKAPPLFCGPEAIASKTAQKPLFPSHDHPSETWINHRFMDKMLGTIEKQFEQDLSFYKPILGDSGAKAFGAALVASQLQASIGGYQNLKKMPKTVDAAAMDKLSAEYQQIAPKVVAIMTTANQGITVTTNADKPFLKLGTHNTINGQDVANLKINFQSAPQATLPGKTLRLEYGSEEDIRYFDKTIEGEAPYNVFVDDILTDPNNGGIDPNNNYENKILVDMLTGVDIYGELLAQIIKEHAEYIADEDLFNRTNFNKLRLTRKNPACKSIMRYDQILKEIEDNVKSLECQRNFAEVPNAGELARLNSFIELAVKIIILREYLKCLLVFGSFGIDALLPDDAPEEKSFYYSYVSNQVFNKLGNWTILVGSYSKQVYAAQLNKPFDEVTTEETVLWIFKKYFKGARAEIAKKLDEAGLNKDKTLEAEYSLETPPSYQILKNIVARHNNAYYEPPPVIKVDFGNRNIIIPKGFYSDNPRLKNGGFFVEYGFDVQHKYKGELGVNDMEAEWKNFLKQKPAPSAPSWASAYDEDPESYITPNQFKQNPKIQGLFGPVLKDDAEWYAFEETFSELVSSIKGMKLTKMVAPDPPTTGKTLPNGAAELHPLKEMSTSEGEKIKSMLKYRGKITFDAYEEVYNTKFIPMMDLFEEFLPGEAGTAAAAQFIDGNRLFNKYNFYYSLNWLIPVPQDWVTMMTGGTAITKKYSQIINATQSGAYDEGFFRSVLDKTMFVKEKDGLTYLKLPIMVFDDVPTPGAINPLPGATPNTAAKLNYATHFYNTNIAGRSPTALFYKNGVLGKIAETEEFKTFEKSIFYKDLLSFLAIMIAEATESQYPSIEKLFNQTLRLISAMVAENVKIADRENDPDWYKGVGTNALDLEMNQPDWGTIIMHVMLMATATMTDPTWRTPWFWPGPLTAVGVVVKLLGELPDSTTKSSTTDSPPPTKEAALEEYEAGIKESFECLDDGNSE